MLKYQHPREWQRGCRSKCRLGWWRSHIYGAVIKLNKVEVSRYNVEFCICEKSCNDYTSCWRWLWLWVLCATVAESFSPLRVKFIMHIVNLITNSSVRVCRRGNRGHQKGWRLNNTELWSSRKVPKPCYQAPAIWYSSLLSNRQVLPL